ncbi:MAG: DUF4412 domain-containing protein [Salinimicrobium sp.]
MRKLVWILLSLFVFSIPAEAQILKKLKKKVERKVENKVTEKLSDKAADETDSMMTRMMGEQMNNSAMMPMGVEQVSIDEVPAQYDFNWKYNARINTTQGDMEMIYRLKNKAPYMGVEMHQGTDVFMVMDTKNDLMAMFFESQGSKMLMASRMKSKQASSEEEFYKDAKIKQIAGKKILGYNCDGYEVETDDHLVKFYITNEADVSFTQMYQYEKSKLPPAIKEEWLKSGNGLLMEMQMIDKKSPSNNASMVCTGLKKEAMIINKSNYQSMYKN